MARVPYLREQHTLNERLVAMEIVRRVLLLRYSVHVRDLVVAALNDTEQPIASSIRDQLHTDAGLRNPTEVQKLEELINQINAVRAKAWDVGLLAAQEELTTAADAEVEDQRALFGFLLPGIELVAPFAIGALVLGTAFLGRTLSRWMADAREAEAARVRTMLYTGIAAGEDPATVARRVVGSARLMGRDGTFQISRNHVDTVIRSGAVHFTSNARDKFYQANAATRYPPKLLPGLELPVPPLSGVEDAAVWEARRQVREALDAVDAAGGYGTGGGSRVGGVFVQEQFVAVLDNRTTPLCEGLDGKRYGLGEGPIPPLHPNCRSDRVLVLPSSLGGPVFDPGTYANWIQRQPRAVQEALLGSRGAQKLTAGDLAIAQFTDYGARPMTLSEVREEGRRLMAAY